jgi:hypothetical protein
MSNILSKGENVPNMLSRVENMPNMFPRGENVPNMLSRGENMPNMFSRGGEYARYVLGFLEGEIMPNKLRREKMSGG